MVRKGKTKTVTEAIAEPMLSPEPSKALSDPAASNVVAGLSKGSQVFIEQQNIKLKSFLSKLIDDKIAEERERIVTAISKIPIPRVVKTRRRMYDDIYCEDSAEIAQFKQSLIDAILKG